MATNLCCPETASDRDARIRKHLFLARAFWAKRPRYLDRGDSYRAKAYGWNAADQLAHALAIGQGWDYCGDDALRDTLTALSDELPEPQGEAIYRGIWAVESLYADLYRDTMNWSLVKSALYDLRPLAQILWGLLPEEYSGGVSFDQWLEEEP